MGEDKKDVWAKLGADVEKYKQDFITPGDIHMLLKWQADTQNAMKEGVGAGVFESDKMRTHTLAAIAELIEALEWTSWKPWKRPTAMTENQLGNAKFEIIDALCFIFNIWRMLGGTPSELMAMYYLKSRENVERQQKGY